MSQTANVFDIKSTNLDVLTLFLKTWQLDNLSQALNARFGSKCDNPQEETFILDIDALENPSLIDLASMLPLLSRHGIRVIALHHSNPGYAALARKHGLIWLPMIPTRPSSIDETLVAPSVTSAPSTFTTPRTLIVDRPVRAGQQLYAKGGDLVALAMVSAGAEVIADGSIHVYAPLRGRALAGARGDITARIFTRCMEAELVSIAGVYRTIEQALPSSIRSKPTQIYLEHERIVMSALSE